MSTYPNTRYRRYRRPKKTSTAVTNISSALTADNMKKALYYAYMAYNLSKALKGKLNTEYKHNDIGPVGFTLTNTWQVQCLNLLNQGTGPNSRNGTSIKTKSVQVKGNITWNSTAAAPQLVRIALIRYKAGNGAALAPASEVYDGAFINSQREMDKTKLVKVLWDRVYPVNDQRPEIRFNFYLRQNVQSDYIGANNLISETGANSYWFCYLSDDGTNSPTGIFSSRVRFIDN